MLKHPVKTNNPAATKSRPKTLKEVPHLKGTWLGANLAQFNDNALHTIIAAQATCGDLVQLRIGPLRYLLVNRPEAVHHIFTGNAKNYCKATKGYKTIKKVLVGDGLLTSNGEHWRVQRRIAQPAFRRQRIAGFAEVMVECAEQMVQSWRDSLGQEGTMHIDVANEMMSLTLRVIGRTMMSTDMQKEAPELGNALTIALCRTNALIQSLPGAELWPSAKNRELKKAVSLLDKSIVGIIAKREQDIATAKEVPNDLLTMLLETVDPETGLGMNAKQLRDEMMTMFLAGHETTANALSWAFYLLAENPDKRAILEREVDHAIAADESFTANDLRTLPYAKQVIEETLRLYPPAWLLARTSIEADELLGVHIPAGTNIFISPYLLGRHEEYWDRADQFCPERFSGDQNIPKGLYIPFIEGARQCIGKSFALMEAQLLLATILRTFRLELKDTQNVQPEPVITLRPKGGMKMLVSLRSQLR